MALAAEVPPLQDADMPDGIGVQDVPPIACGLGVIGRLLIISPAQRIDIQQVVIYGF